MSRIFSFVLLAFACFNFGCASSRHSTALSSDVLYAKDFIPYGRSGISEDQSLQLISSAMHFGFRFTGKECKLYASIPQWLDRNYLQYELDGVYQKRIRITNENTGPILLTATNEGTHVIWIYKATEAHTGPIYVQKIEARNVQSLQKPRAQLVEFIGNSITCGAAADASEVACGTGQYHDQHNAYYAYGPRVARMLGWNYIVSSVSGIGIYRNWNSDGPAMPEVYEKLDFQENNSNRWDFKRYNPNIVTIALGTNDLSNGDGTKTRLPFDSARFVSEYVSFVKLVKSKYASAEIVLLNSPMLNGNRKSILENCLVAVKKTIDSMYSTGKPIQLFYFKPMQGRGCTGHPSVEDHAILAQELEPFLKKLMN